jgi:hypothetical protein
VRNGYVMLDKGWIEKEDGSLRVQDYQKSAVPPPQFIAQARFGRNRYAYDMEAVNGVYTPIPKG